jgi:hypothetical protein
MAYYVALIFSLTNWMTKTTDYRKYYYKLLVFPLFEAYKTKFETP